MKFPDLKESVELWFMKQMGYVKLGNRVCYFYPFEGENQQIASGEVLKKDEVSQVIRSSAEIQPRK